MAAVDTDTSASKPTPDTAPAPLENVLIVLLDDVGNDNLGVTAEGEIVAPSTPTLDALAAEGVLFRNAYVSPMCSPTRANLLTGRYGRRTGIGHLVNLRDEVELDPAEVGLAELLDYSPRTWSTSLAGKWHLGTSYMGRDVGNHPASLGFDWYAGSLENLVVTLNTVDAPGYFRWEKNDNGVLGLSETYATTDTVDDAVARMGAMPEPWLMYVAVNAGHEPFHAPPRELHGVEELEGFESPNWMKYDAAVEALDTELARLLASIPADVRARTTIIALSDNGTPPEVTTPPLDPGRAKGTLYDHGVRVPLVVAGPRVAQPGSVSDAFVHAVDVFATVADLADVPLDGPGAPPFVGPIDGISLIPWLEDPAAPTGRPYVFSEKFKPNGAVESTSTRMIRDAEWKLIRQVDPRADTDWFFRYEPGAMDEGPDLLAAGPLDAEAAEAYARLSTELDALVATLAE